MQTYWIEQGFCQIIETKNGSSDMSGLCDMDMSDYAMDQGITKL